MKNKKVLYFLLPATLLVWVMIFIRIYNSLNTGSEISNVPISQIQKGVTENSVSDTFSIDNNYRDPFHGNHSSTASIKNPSETPTAKKIEKTVTPKTVISWPSIQYSGMIKNQKSNKQLAMIQINGSLQTLKSGDGSNNIIIGKISKDSVEVILGKEKRFFKK